jgi:hypothetical protein
LKPNSRSRAKRELIPPNRELRELPLQPPKSLTIPSTTDLETAASLRPVDIRQWRIIRCEYGDFTVAILTLTAVLIQTRADRDSERRLADINNFGTPDWLLKTRVFERPAELSRNAGMRLSRPCARKLLSFRAAASNRRFCRDNRSARLKPPHNFEGACAHAKETRGE